MKLPKYILIKKFDFNFILSFLNYPYPLFISSDRKGSNPLEKRLYTYTVS